MRFPWPAVIVVCSCTDINEDELLLPTPADTDTGVVDFGGGDNVWVLNGKLSSKEAGYTANEKGIDDRWIGSSIHVWDPGAPDGLSRLGWLDFGPDSVDHDWEIMAAREIALAPDGTLWALLVDQGTEDEWILAQIDVPDAAARDQPLGVTAYVVHPDDTDLYDTEEYTGMGFSDDGTLWLCSPADGAFPGALFTVSGWPPTFADADEYYASTGLGELHAEFSDNLGCAGDIEGGFALVRPGNDFAAHELWDVQTSTGSGGVDTDPSEPLTGLSWANGYLWAVGIEGDIYLVDDATGTFTLFTSLGTHFPVDDLGQSTRRLRGTAGWTP